MGAKVVSELYTAGVICKGEAERLLPFCNNSGPLFIIGAIGSGMLKDTGLGIKLYLIHITSAILVGLFFKRYGEKNKIKNKISIKSMVGRELRATMGEKKQSFGKILSETVSSAVSTMMLICGFVVLFSVLSQCITPLIDVLMQNEQIKLFSNGIFEITAGISRIAECVNMTLSFKMLLISFLTGFGGICVHLQVIGVTSGSGLNMGTYIIGKIMQAIFAGALAFVLFK
jgi:sporulation integral membrane protein YlbJ